MSITNRIAPLVLAAALLPLAAQAHQTWLLANQTQFSAGREAPVAAFDAAVSEDLFIFERGLKLDTLRITGPDGQPLEAENRTSSRHRESFEVKLPLDGTYRVSHISQSIMGAYKAGGETKRFRTTPANLAKDVPADAEITSFVVNVARQQTFVSREQPGKLGFAPEGQGLELLPLGPVTDLSHGDRTRFVLMLDGKPLPGATLRLLRDGNRYRYKLGEEALKSDDKGELTVTWTEPGRYLIAASVGERPAPGQPQGTRDKPLQRASLAATFEVLPK
ncbi:MAG: DUF4198 domain-containing protein [Roseateles sp.]